MYKFFLCWRYLLTRYIALASVISVMLGVATMIVVNAVMLGFTSEMKDRLHGIFADVIFQTYDLNKGFPNYEWHRSEIFRIAGDLIEEATPTVVTKGIMVYQVDGVGTMVSFEVDIVGVDVLTQGKVSKIAEYLQHPANRANVSFDLRNGGYDVQGSNEGPIRELMRYAGWERRRNLAAQIRWRKELEATKNAAQTDSAPPVPQNPDAAVDPFAGLSTPESATFDMATEQHAGIIVGIGTSLYRRTNETCPETGKKIVTDDLMLVPGDDVLLAFPIADLPPRFQYDSFTVVDLYESKMVEYDRKLVFVPLEKLQRLRGMADAESNTLMITQILIKAKPGVDIDVLRDRLKSFFPDQMYSIKTWRDEQADLLNAIFTELAMLNVLLFLIFAVAGFGILAIFYMIVIEKQKDIGILKSLGASSGGVMQIFLYYSLLLGLVGSGLGLGLGLLFVRYIKEVAVVLSYILQRDVFSPEVYSFYEIPTKVDPSTVIWIIAGAIIIAVSAGVLPAMRAARVHPVETLRS
jgi:lipoprotein-releasing system permease protein